MRKENVAQMAKILRKSEENHKAQFPILSIFVGQKSILVGQKSILNHYYILNVIDGI